MLELKKGVDILTAVGAIKSIDAARNLLDARLDQANKDKLARITNEDALVKIANAISICGPDKVFINTGSETDVLWIRKHALDKGEERPLAKKDTPSISISPRIRPAWSIRLIISSTKARR